METSGFFFFVFEMSVNPSWASHIKSKKSNFKTLRIDGIFWSWSGDMDDFIFA